MNKLKFAILFILIFALTGCSSKEQVLYGEYADVKTSTRAAYQKSYLMMDCCDEWLGFVDFVRHIKGASSVEGFEYYLYDENESVLPVPKNTTVIFHPSEEFRSRTGEIKVCTFPEGYLCEAVALENGDIEFKTDKDGVFAVIKCGDEMLWISNLDCTGQCRTCSDEW